MVAALSKSIFLLAAVVGASSSPTAQDQTDQSATRLANGMAQASPQNAAIASAIAQWTALKQTDALPFGSYASFLMAHPGWPNEPANRRAAERQAALGTGTNTDVVAFFRRYPPRTGSGMVAFARALQSIGGQVEANKVARDAWRNGVLSSDDESTLLTSFPNALSVADHDARMDALLWAGATTAARRQLSLTSAAKRPVFEARLAFRTKSSDAAGLASATQALYANDPGYIADRATWMRNTLDPATREYLARPRQLASLPGDPEKWYEVLLVNARGAAADGQYQTAYDIARQVDDAYPPGTDISTKDYGQRDDYTSLAWLAGDVAMHQLNRPADAMVMFERYGRGSRSPQTRAKGFYWAGRAAAVAGRAADAAMYYNRAAGYRDQYYGQLALERTGQPLSAPPAIAARTVAPQLRNAFDLRETVQAARLLGNIGDYQDQTAFIRQIASDATTETDHLLAAQLSLELHRPDLGVMVGRSALQNGLTDYAATGYPTVTVPPGYEDQWTLIHAVARQESQFDRAAISPAGARGLMQLMPATAREQSSKMGLSYSADALTTDPSLSMRLGSSYFQRIFDRFGSYPLAIAAYNAGGGNVNKWLRAYGDPRTDGVNIVDWIEDIPYLETRNYVQRVLENAVVYDLMNPAHAKSSGPDRLSWYLGKKQPG